MPGESDPSRHVDEQAVIDDVYDRMFILTNEAEIVPMRMARRVTQRIAGGPDGPDWATQWMNRFTEAKANQQSWSVGEMHQWQDEAWVQFNDTITYAGGDARVFKWLKAALSPKATIPFNMLNKFWYVAQMVLPGRIGVLTGQKDGGKSNHGLLLAELMIGLKRQQIEEDAKAKLKGKRRGDSELAHIMAYMLGGRRRQNFDLERYRKEKMSLLFAKDIRVVSNIKVGPGHEYSEYFQYAATLSDTYDFIFGNALNDFFTFFVMDEMGKAMPVTRTSSGQNEAITNWLREIRKPNTSGVMLTQDLRRDFGARVGTDERIGIRMFITKIKPRVAIYQVDDVPALQWVRIAGVPGTTLPYGTKDLAGFRADLSPKVLTDAVEIIRKVSMDSGHEWTVRDTFQMIRQVAHKIRSLDINEVKQAHNDPKNSLVYLLGTTIRPGTNPPRVFSADEIAKETGMSPDMVREKIAAAATGQTQKSAYSERDD